MISPYLALCSQVHTQQAVVLQKELSKFTIIIIVSNIITILLLVYVYQYNYYLSIKVYKIE